MPQVLPTQSTSDDTTNMAPLAAFFNALSVAAGRSMPCAWRLDDIKLAMLLVIVGRAPQQLVGLDRADVRHLHDNRRVVERVDDGIAVNAGLDEVENPSGPK